MKTHGLLQSWDRIPREFYLGFGTGIVCTALFAAALGTHESSSVSKQTAVQAPAASAAQTNAAAQADIASRLDAAKQQGIEIGKQQASASSAASSSNQVWVYIPAGASITEIANLFMAAGVCQDGNAFIEKAENSGVLIKSGSFALPLKGDAGQILQIVSSK